MGLSWAHVLGDAIAAIDCMNTWSQYLVGPKPFGPKPNETISTFPKSPCTVERDPVSLKRVESVGDHWIYNSECNLKTFIFQLTIGQLKHVSLKFFKSDHIPLFESICAVLWKLISEARGGVGRVTICKNDSSKRAKGSLGNSQKIRVVEAEVPTDDPMELLRLLREHKVDENELIEEAVERSNGLGDFIMYGANLTFVDLGEAELYGMKLKGGKPLFADYSIQGVGREGVVIVAPGPKSDKSSQNGMVVTVVLPEEQIPELKDKLKTNDLVFDNHLI